MKTKLLLILLFFSLITKAQTNLVLNGEFEAWTNGTKPAPADWTIKNSVSQNTAYFAQVGKSIQLSIANNATKPEITTQVPLIAGKTYIIKFKYKYLDANFNGQHPISLKIIQDGSSTTLSSSSFATNNNWTVKETTFSPDQNLSYNLSISLSTFDDAAFNVLIDNVQVYEQGTEQYTLIPDVNFEKKLIALNLDVIVDGKVLTLNINSLTTLNVTSSSIVNLTGIQDFVALTSLYCYNNQLTSLDVSKNKALTSLYCYSNKITNLDLTKNTALNELYCYANKLTTLDLSLNTSLTELICYRNQLSSLDISKNKALTHVNCFSNKLTTVNLKNGKNNLITTISLTDNPDLSCITVDDVAYTNANWSAWKDAAAIYSAYDCSTVTLIPDASFEDKLIALGIDSDGKNGVVLNSSISTLTSLDVSNSSIIDLTGIQAFTSLTTLNVSNNLLKALDLSKNAALTTLNCLNNATLSCIQVADVAVATNNWTTTKDPKASFNLDCTPYTLIPDTNFEAKLIALGIDDIADGKVMTSKINTLTSLNVSKSAIVDLTGIQDFLSLNSLDCSFNAMTVVDVSKVTTLKLLDVNNNQLSNINISKNLALEKLEIGSNLITNIDITNNLALKELHIYGNKIETLDTSKNVALTKLIAFITDLKSIDVSQNTALTSLLVRNTQLTAIDVSKNILLREFNVSFNKIKTIDVSKNPRLTSLIVFSNQLTSLNLKNGNNSLLYNNEVSFAANPQLYCIQVDDAASANTYWSNKKDAIATYNTECTGELTLPSNNFTVEAKGESCLGENNGEINVNTKAAFICTASIGGANYPFVNNRLAVTNLAPGTYTMLITIPGTTFEQIFNVTIPKGATITGKSSITKKEVSVEITEGTAPFTVFVNGIEQFETNNSTFSVTAKGGGLLEVKTSKACEGVYAAAIDGLDIVLAAYPNPTSGSFEIELPTSKREVTIEINTLDGRIISTKNYTLENGKAKLTLENQPKGVYIAKIYLDTIKNVKIIKN